MYFGGSSMSKIKIALTNLAKNHLFFRKIFRGILYAYKNMRYKIRRCGKKIDDKMVFFSSFNGKYYTDSPKAIYLYMKNNPEFKDYKFVWAFREPENYKELEDEHTILVKQNTKKYEEYLAKSKYWIINHRIYDYIYPKKEQVYVQCWHGTPLKRLGCDLQKTENALNTLKEVKKKWHIEAKKVNFVISPSKFTTEKLSSALDLKSVNKEDCMIEQGYPRNDFLYNYTEDDVKAALNLMGKEVGPLRLPLTEMEAAHQAVLAEEMKKFGIKLA